MTSHLYRDDGGLYIGRMAFTNEDKQFILTAIKGSEERILGQVPDIVNGIVKDAVLDSEARVTKKILDHVDKRLDVKIGEVREDIKQLRFLICHSDLGGGIPVCAGRPAI